MLTATTSIPTTKRFGDDEISEDDALRVGALELLHSNGYTALRRLGCEVTKGVVIVHGVVQSYYLKQVAQTIVRQVDGVQGVRNMVEVRAENHQADVLA